MIAFEKVESFDPFDADNTVEKANGWSNCFCCFNAYSSLTRQLLYGHAGIDG